MDIKNVLEVYDFLEAVCDAVLKATADGKLNLLDLAQVLGPAKLAAAAVRDADQIVVELKDLDEGELNKVIERLVLLAPKLTEAFLALSAVLK